MVPYLLPAEMIWVPFPFASASASGDGSAGLVGLAGCVFGWLVGWAGAGSGDVDGPVPQAVSRKTSASIDGAHDDQAAGAASPTMCQAIPSCR